MTIKDVSAYVALLVQVSHDEAVVNETETVDSPMLSARAKVLMHPDFLPISDSALKAFKMSILGNDLQMGMAITASELIALGVEMGLRIAANGGEI